MGFGWLVERDWGSSGKSRAVLFFLGGKARLFFGCEFSRRLRGRRLIRVSSGSRGEEEMNRLKPMLLTIKTQTLKEAARSLVSFSRSS